MKFCLFVPTYNPGESWHNWISAFREQTSLPHKVCIVDSSSSDQTADLSTRSGFTVKVIRQEDFNHGATRQLALDMCDDTDVIIYLTQDAILDGNDSLKNLMDAFLNPEVGLAYGRQKPRKVASAIEAHARLYNYPDLPAIRSIADAPKLGLKAAFASNSFAAYRVSALRDIGGFPEDVIFGEDMYVATKMLLKNYKIAYVSSATVYHSHDYTLMQDMRRYFDMGVFHASQPWIRKQLGGAEGQAGGFVKSELGYLVEHDKSRVIEWFLRNACRYLGYRLGLVYRRLPNWLNARLAMNKRYFMS